MRRNVRKEERDRRTLRSQFSLMRMLLGFWDGLLGGQEMNGRWKDARDRDERHRPSVRISNRAVWSVRGGKDGVGEATDKNLVEEVLNELLVERTGSE